jgi:hypothetical protein
MVVFVYTGYDEISGAVLLVLRAILQKPPLFFQVQQRRSWTTTTFVVVFLNFYFSVCLKEAVRNRSSDGVARDESVKKQIGNPVLAAKNNGYPVSLLNGSPGLIDGRDLIVRDSEGDSGLKALLRMVSHHENRSPSDLLTITVKTLFILELLHRCGSLILLKTDY